MGAKPVVLGGTHEITFGHNQRSGGTFGSVDLWLSANAQQGKGEACRAAVQAKRPCMGTMPNTVNRTACLKSAMQRCKQGGPGAI